MHLTQNGADSMRRRVPIFGLGSRPKVVDSVCLGFGQVQDQQTVTQVGAARLVVNVGGQLQRTLKVTAGTFAQHESLVATVHFAQARHGELPPVQGDLEVVLRNARQVDDQPVGFAEVEQVDLKLEALRGYAVCKFAHPVTQDKQLTQVSPGVVVLVQLHCWSLAPVSTLNSGVRTFSCDRAL